jgi:alginate O-acetyltransferase complex protein AlgJ
MTTDPIISREEAPLRGPGNGDRGTAPGSDADVETEAEVEAEIEAEIHEGDEATIADELEEPVEAAAPRPEGISSPHRSRVLVIPLVAALVFFFGPAVAYLVGDRPDTIDNRPLADMPSASDGWDYFGKFTTWANDHLPLRSQAVERSTQVSERVFKQPPNYGQAAPPAADGVAYPKVIPGSDGWLYFGGDVSGSCNPKRSVDEVVGSLQRLSTAIQSSGRRLVLAIAPDKSTMVPEHLPGRYAGKACAAERRAAIWDKLRSAGLPLLDLQGALEKAQDRTGSPLYRKTDSHWSPQGASVFVEQVLNRLDPALLAGKPSPFVAGSQIDLPGDLGRMIGTPTRDEAVRVTAERPGVTLTVGGRTVEPTGLESPGSLPFTIDASSTGPALIPDRTAVLGDSFLGASRSLLFPFFADLTVLHNQSGPNTLAQTIADADTVVVELVERSVASGELELTNPAVVDVVEKTLAASPHRP